MTKSDIIEKLTRNGYKIVNDMIGNIIVEKRGRQYKANSFAAIIKLIF